MTPLQKPYGIPISDVKLHKEITQLTSTCEKTAVETAAVYTQWHSQNIRCIAIAISHRSHADTLLLKGFAALLRPLYGAQSTTEEQERLLCFIHRVPRCAQALRKAASTVPVQPLASQVAATVASNSYASVESTETAKAMSSQPAGILCSHLDGKGPCVDDQWTGVRDDCPMPGKFGQEGESNGPCEADGSVDGKVGVPKAFAHMLQTKEEPKSPAVAMASEPTTREWTEAEWRGGGWWQDGGWSAADGSWPHDGEEAADDGIWAADGEEAADHGVWAADGDGWWTTAAAWWDPEMEKKRFPPLVPLEWTGTGMVPSKKAATVSNGPETMGVGASAVVAYT